MVDRSIEFGVSLDEVSGDNVELLSLLNNVDRLVEDSEIGFEDIEDDEQPQSENKSFVDVVPEINLPDSWGRHGDFWLVGHGEVTNHMCGMYLNKKLKGCLNVHKHNVTRLDGRNFAGNVYVQKRPCYCYKPDCPKCFKFGWAVREAFRASDRLKAVSGHGLVEHIILSIASSDYGLSLKEARSKAVKFMERLGVSGGCLIFHAFRYERGGKGWFYSPHWHILGFVEGGFKCRSCPSRFDCKVGCDGFNAKRWALYQETGYYSKVMDKRITVGGTLWYQLTHASYQKSEGKKRSSIVTWFGICSYRKLKFTAEIRKKLCPICGSELERIEYLGKLAIGQLVGEGKYGEDLYLDYRDEDDNVVWRVAPSRSKGGGVIADAKELDYESAYQAYEESFAVAGIEAPEPSPFYKHCALCHQPITDVSQLRMLDGKRPVHRMCIHVGVA